MEMDKTTYTLLDKVNSPADIKAMSIDELRVLCEEIRHYMNISMAGEITL
jgi:deoxyxylulose-5-phosphate synthase